MSATRHIHGETSEDRPVSVLSAVDRGRLGRRAQLLAGAAVAYNVVEAVIAIAAGVAAGSVALVGFGLDSIVEVSSGLIILWQFRHSLPESREKQALRAMAYLFFALATYVAFESARALLTGADPDTSTVGMALAAASLVLMPFLSFAQRRTGRALSSSTVVADSTQTMLCTYLSAVLLVGLVLNATLGWSWADPIAGLVIAAVAAREGLQAWRGENCCAPVAGAESGADGCAAACCAAPSGTNATAVEAAGVGPGERTTLTQAGPVAEPERQTSSGGSGSGGGF